MQLQCRGHLTNQDDDVTGDVMELTFSQRLELSMQVSQCLFSPVISPPSDADRHADLYVI